MTIAKYKQKKLATMAESHGREHRKTTDIPHTPAKPGTWQDGIEATASVLYSAVFAGGQFPAMHPDYPLLNRLVECLKLVQWKPVATDATPCTPLQS
jgi:hypothetical protein